MRSFFCFPLMLFLLLPPAAVLAQTPKGGPPSPTGFNAAAKAPQNLPSKLNIPANTHIDVVAARKAPSYLQANPQLLLMDPDLVSAVIERDANDVHATFNWQGDHSSEAFIIKGVCFRPNSLKFPNSIATSGPVLAFRLSGQFSTDGAGGDFPDVFWYSPSTFVGTASLNGNQVLVFTLDGNQKSSKGEPSATATFPGGYTICLNATSLLPVWISDSSFVYTFTYTPDSHVQINPRGSYLKTIQARFGHYP